MSHSFDYRCRQINNATESLDQLSGSGSVNSPVVEFICAAAPLALFSRLLDLSAPSRPILRNDANHLKGSQASALFDARQGLVAAMSGAVLITAKDPGSRDVPFLKNSPFIHSGRVYICTAGLSLGS